MLTCTDRVGAADPRPVGGDDPIDEAAKRANTRQRTDGTGQPQERYHCRDPKKPIEAGRSRAIGCDDVHRRKRSGLVKARRPTLAHDRIGCIPERQAMKPVNPRQAAGKPAAHRAFAVDEHDQVRELHTRILRGKLSG